MQHVSYACVKVRWCTLNKLEISFKYVTRTNTLQYCDIRCHTAKGSQKFVHAYIVHLKFSEPRKLMLSTMIFLLICDEDVFKNKSGLVAGPATLGNSYNWHKSKMAAMNAINFFIYCHRMVSKCLNRVFGMQNSFLVLFFAI